MEPRHNGGPGKILEIYICAVAGGQPQSMASVEAVAGRGLWGDRYFHGRGSYSHWPGNGRQVTLIAVEAIRALPGPWQVDGADLRRNIVTGGIDLDKLIGVEFRIGDALLRGTRECEPCAYLEELTHPGMYGQLRGRGGLRADIVRGGKISVGDDLLPQGESRC